MLGFCLLIMTSVTCTGVLAKEDVSSDNYNDIICQQVSELIGVPEESIQTVKLQNSTTESIFKFKEDNENDRALEVVSERNGVIEKKLIFPKIVIDGELINSFDYAEDDNYGLMCTHYLDHTGAVGYSINYTVNGTTRYDRSSQTVFSK